MSAAVKPIDPKQAQDPAQVADATRLAAQHALAQSFSTLQEIVAAARRNLSQGTWDMLSGGSDSEATLRRNRMALDSLPPSAWDDWRGTPLPGPAAGGSAIGCCRSIPFPPPPPAPSPAPFKLHRVHRG